MKNGVREFVCIGCGRKVVKSCAKTVKYCSPECYHKNRNYSPPKRGVYKKCIQCGKEFYVPQHRKDTSIACSRQCHNEYQGRNKVNLVCIVCGEEFTRSKCFHKQKYCSVDCRNKDPEFKARLLEMNVKQSRNSPNKFEAMAYKLMDEIGIEYTPQFIIGGKFVVDAFVPSKNTVIELDGDYWHGNKAKYPKPDSRQRKRMALDISQNAYMEKMGIKVVRIWQSEFDDLPKVRALLEKI